MHSDAAQFTDNQSNFRIPVQNMPAFEAHMGKLIKKAESLGFKDEVGFLELHEETVTNNGRVQRYMNVVVFGAAPKMEGYTFAASIEHTPEGLSLVRENSSRPIPAELRSIGPVCQHCFQNRFRKNTFILKGENGSYVSVGSTCLNDFTGLNASPAKIASWMESFDSLKEMTVVPAESADQEYPGYGPRYPMEFELRHALAAAAIDMEQRGGYFKFFEDGPTSTAEMVSLAIGMYRVGSGYCPAESITDVLRDAEKSQQYFSKADEAIAWAKGLSDTDVAVSSYMHNIRNIAILNYTTHRSIRMAASIMVAHERSKPRADAAPKKPSEFVGTKGERIQCVVAVKAITAVVGFSYGGNETVKDLVIMEDVDGNKLTWFCEGNNPLKKGDTDVKVKLTIKGHEEYKGIKQTKVNRVALVK
jgi:hypothetical protein